MANVIDRVLDLAPVYRLWQMPFAGQKFAPVARTLGSKRPTSVLDIGCGPGTNAARFLDTGYVGVDLNPTYVHAATARFGERFHVGDASEDLPTDGAPYDLVLINSLLHHLDDGQVESVLTKAASLLDHDGEIHILDHELPAERSAARFLTTHDRGKFMRPREDWHVLLGRVVDVRSYEPFPLTLLGWPLWRMFHCRAAQRAQSAPR